MGGRGRGGKILGRYGEGGRVRDVLGYLMWQQFRGGREGTGKIMASICHIGMLVVIFGVFSLP